MTQRALLLALAGFASAIVTNATAKLGNDLGWFYPGLVFGVAIATVLFLHYGARSPLRLIGFVVACTAAYPISIWTVVVTNLLSKGQSDSRTAIGGIPILGFFIAGCAGALIVYLAASAVAQPVHGGWRFAARIFFACLLGGVLGVFGIVVSNAIRLSPGSNNEDAVQDPILSIIWQTGVALCGAFVLSVNTQDAPAPASMRGRLLAVVVLGFSVLGYLSLRLLR